MKSAYALFLAALVATAAFVLATTPGLPDRVGTHFGPGGGADGWMTRDGYRLYMLAFVLLFVPFIVAMVGVLPRALPARRQPSATATTGSRPSGARRRSRSSPVTPAGSAC